MHVTNIYYNVFQKKVIHKRRATSTRGKSKYNYELAYKMYNNYSYAATFIIIIYDECTLLNFR